MIGDAAIKRWEYKVVEWKSNVWGTGGEWQGNDAIKDFSTEQLLNAYGHEGWEFVSIGPVADSSASAVAYIFRRPLV